MPDVHRDANGTHRVPLALETCNETSDSKNLQSTFHSVILFIVSRAPTRPWNLNCLWNVCRACFASYETFYSFPRRRHESVETRTRSLSSFFYV